MAETGRTPEAEPEPEPVTELGPATEPGSDPYRARTPGPVTRRRLAEVFGDVLPESTGDDRDEDRPARPDDNWYTENRPPHHDSP